MRSVKLKKENSHFLNLLNRDSSNQFHCFVDVLFYLNNIQTTTTSIVLSFETICLENVKS